MPLLHHSQLVTYTFLFWLPYYLHHVFPTMEDSEAASYSSTMDFGGVFGGIVAGFLADRFNVPAVVSFTFLILSALCMFVYRWYGGVSIELNVALMFVLGILVNGVFVRRAL